MRPLISERAAATIDELRVRGWDTAWLTSDPQVSLVLYPYDSDVAREAQDVVVAVGTGAGRESGGGTGVAETETQITFRRPISYGFTVEIGDTFNEQGMSGTIVRVWQHQGMVWALADLDVGTT